MQHNNYRSANDGVAVDPADSLERTAAGRWASVVPISYRSGPPASTEVPALAPEVQHASSTPSMNHTTSGNGTPPSRDGGRWIPNTTAFSAGDLTHGDLNPSGPTAGGLPSGADDLSHEWHGFGDGGFGGNGVDGSGVGGFGIGGVPAASMNDDDMTGFGQNDPWSSGQSGLDGTGRPGDFADYADYPNSSTGAFDVIGNTHGDNASASFYNQPVNEYSHDPLDSAFGAGAGEFADGFDNPGAIDAIDSAGRNFDEEELETGMAARRNAIEWAVVLVAAVLLALVLRAVLLQAFYIPSPSMEETLLIDDRVLVNKLSYRLNDISLGDIVVFNRTEVEIASSDPDDPRDVIKRVIATEGQQIEIRDNQVFINDQLLSEPYLNPDVAMADFGPQVIPEGHIFVMGDNRDVSADSRGETGPVAEERVVGRAFFLFWPLNRLSVL